uniref:Uncharacterized protein n=1 Tax=Anguilla anguilla TaxID=7936 RepID=A0A0E9RYL6_ANGAN
MTSVNLTPMAFIKFNGVLWSPEGESEIICQCLYKTVQFTVLWF